jgi:AcrR family transcriptional regulator
VGASARKVPSAPRRRTQGERRAASEEKLLAAATKLIAQRGSSKASFAEIAARADCSHSLPFYLFGSKAAMLEALVDNAGDKFVEEVLGRALDGARGLRAISIVGKVFVQSLADPWAETRAIYVLIGESLGANPELRPALNSYHARLRKLIRGWIEEAIEDGEVSSDVDAETQATLILSTLRGVGFSVLSDPEAFDLKKLTAATTHTLRRIASGE